MKYGEQNLNLAGEMARSHWLAAGEKNNSFSRVISPISPRGIQGGFFRVRQLNFLNFMVKKSFFHLSFRFFIIKKSRMTRLITYILFRMKFDKS